MKGTLFYRGKGKLGGAVLNKASIGGNWKFEVQWHFTYWVIFPGEEKTFFSIIWGSRVENTSCWRGKAPLYFGGTTHDEWQGMRTPPAGHPNSSVG